MALPSTQVDQGMAEALKARGFGYLYSDPVGVGARIFVGEEGPEPDEAITVILDGPGPGGNRDRISESYALTVRCRAQKYERASELAFGVMKSLITEEQGLFGGVLVARAVPSTPVPLGRDRDGQGGRWIFTLPVALLVKANDT
jgi:hypothetical protein